MKHVLLITAYDQPGYLLEHLWAYDHDNDFRVYIHWDRKTLADCRLEDFRHHPSVRWIESLYPVNWGGRNLLASMLELCRAALADTQDVEECFFHLLSGSDLLVRPVEELKRFFSAHPQEGFVDYFPLPDPRWDGGGLARLKWRYPLDHWDIRHKDQAAVYDRYMRMQFRCGTKRPLPDIPLYGGSCWCSLPRYMAAYWAEHADDNGLFQRMKDVYAPEEIHLPTVLLNAPFASRVRRTNLRYICWDYGHRGTPAVLEPYDLPRIEHSDAVWSRKALSGRSDDVIQYYKWLDALPSFDDSDNPLDVRLMELASYLREHTASCPLPGLMNGKMGAILFLFCEGRVLGDAPSVQSAHALLKDAVARRKELVSADFHNGTFGFAYALGWLFKHGFVEEDEVGKVLVDFDGKCREALSDPSFRAYANDAFWARYYGCSLYADLRNLLSGYSLRRIEASTLYAWMKCGGQPFSRRSIGLSGLAGRGYGWLREGYPSLTPELFD